MELHNTQHKLFEFHTNLCVMVVRAWQESSVKKCSMILIVMMKPQRIMLSNNLLEVGKYSKKMNYVGIRRG